MFNERTNVTVKILENTYDMIFVVEPCMLIVLSPLFVQLKHTNYYKIVNI